MTSDSLRTVNVCVILIASLWLGCPTESAAIEPILRANLTRKSPRVPPTGSGYTSLAVFYGTPQGQLVLLPGQGILGTGSNAYVSNDQGQTWETWDAFSTWPKMAYTDVIRDENNLLAFCQGTQPFAGTYLYTSTDNGLTWTGGNRLTSDSDRWSPMNQRVLLTSSGRLIVPIEQIMSGAEGSGPNNVGTVFSDNRGQSWQRSPLIGPPSGYPTTPEGIGEPAVVELANGKMWMVARGLGGRLLQAWSDDGGASWGPASATSLVSPLAPPNAKRIPGSNAVITLWDNAVSDRSNPKYPWHPRSPLVFAISKDNCQTWSDPVVIATGAAAYPSMCFMDDKMFISYWENPDPNGSWVAPDSHLMVVAYDIPSLLAIP